MHGHTRWVSRDRPDFVRSAAERCWIDGDLIRLSQWPIGGIRPGVRGKPVPWLMDLAVLEEAMQEVYGRGFCLDDRAPLLQLAADALADGDRTRAAEIADAVAFPPPEFKSRFRDAGLRYLAWGPAHNRGNSRIDIEAWLARSDVERKYDPDQPRVPRGHPDGGQWTDGSGAGSDGAAGNVAIPDDDAAGGSDGVETGEEPLTEEQQRLVEILDDAQRGQTSGGSESAPLVLAGGDERPPKFPRTKRELLAWIAAWLSEEIKRRGSFPGRNSPIWMDIDDFAREAVRRISWILPEFEGYWESAKEWEEMVADKDFRDFNSFEAFKGKYKSAGPFRDWHHIVEQGSGFSRKMINNTANIVRIPRGKHWDVVHAMTKPRNDLGGLSWREWLVGRPFSEHMRVGLDVLREVKALK